MVSIEEKMKKLDEKKQKLKYVEKILKEKEKRQRSKSFESIGRLALKTNIDQLNQKALLGAFLEIAAKSSDQKNIKIWNELADQYLAQKENSSQEALMISLKTEPSKELKQKLKEKNFKWNSIIKKFYGRGSKKELESLLSTCDADIEIVE